MNIKKSMTALGVVAGVLMSGQGAAQTPLFYPEARTAEGLMTASSVIQTMANNDSLESIRTIGLNEQALAIEQ
jgi:hypothetical protein